MQNEILELEKTYWNAIENQDFDVIKKLTHFPCIVAGRKGVQALEETVFKQMMDAGNKHQLKVVKILQENIEIINETTAAIGYLIEIKNKGENEKTTQKYACTSAWVKENGEWKCVLHTESDLEQS